MKIPKDVMEEMKKKKCGKCYIEDEHGCRDTDFHNTMLIRLGADWAEKEVKKNQAKSR